MWLGVDKEEMRRSNAPRMASFLWINIWACTGTRPTSVFLARARVVAMVVYWLLVVRTDSL